MIKLRQINDAKVEPIPIAPFDKKLIKGSEYFCNLYNNVFICARKRSGKTTLIYNIIKKCTDKETRFFFFVSTINKDRTYKEILKYLDKRGNIVYTFKSIMDGKHNNLKEIMDSLNEEPEEDEESEEDYPFKDILEKPKKKKKKKKLLTPDIMFIFDDLSKELQNAQVERLLKANRHYKSKVLLSSQWVSDLRPSSRRQIDNYILFGGHSVEKLQNIYIDMDVSLPYDDFIKIYNHATKDKYNFLNISSDGFFFKNFNKKYFIE
jgi:hypothetical protein